MTFVDGVVYGAIGLGALSYGFARARALRKAEEPVFRNGDAVHVRIDADAPLWTPGVIVGFDERASPAGFKVRGYVVTLTDGGEWFIHGADRIRHAPDEPRAEERPAGYR